MFAEFQTVFTQLAILFAIVAVGYVAKKVHVMDENLDKKLSALVLDISMPALILCSVLDADELPTTSVILQTLALSVASYILLALLAFVVTAAMRAPRGQRGTFRFMLMFANTGFVGYPVISAVFGPEYVIYACANTIFFNLLVFTVGVWFIATDGESDAKAEMKAKNFLSPSVLASLAAIVCALLGVHSVPFIGPALTTLGDFTTPAALLIVGSSLANLPVRGLLGSPRVWIASVSRLIVAPVLIWGVLHFFASGTLLAIFVVLASMPVATNGTMLCYQYGGNSKVMAQGTFITTVCSLITIPLIATMLVV